MDYHEEMSHTVMTGIDHNEVLRKTNLFYWTRFREQEVNDDWPSSWQTKLNWKGFMLRWLLRLKLRGLSSFWKQHRIWKINPKDAAERFKWLYWVELWLRIWWMETESPRESERERENCGSTVRNKPCSTVLTHGEERVPRDAVHPSAEFSLM